MAVNLLESIKKGVPNIMFSAKPYSAFSFQVAGVFQISGTGSWAGLIGMAVDANNFIGARFNTEKAQIFMVRQGTLTVLAEQTHTFSPAVDTPFFFEHRNGDFSIRIQTADQWGDPLLTYRWAFADGPLSWDFNPLLDPSLNTLVQNSDLFHVGIYSLIDVPHFRITSFALGAYPIIGFLPGGDSADFAAFPSSGQVDIDGVIYSYTDKITRSTELRGPFEFFSYGTFNETNSFDGQHYPGYGAGFSKGASCAGISYADFLWLDGDEGSAPINRGLNKGDILATDQAYNWPAIDTEWKAFVVQTGQQLYLDRAKTFCSVIKSEPYISTEGKLWITSGLTGVKLITGQTNSLHGPGSYCFLHNNESITLKNFAASSGDHDATVADMLAMISRMAGAKTNFAGDRVIATANLSGTPLEI
jgi:hypothetical protein